MDLQTLAKESMGNMESVFGGSERVAEMIDFAKGMGIADGIVMDVNHQPHPAAEYAIHLYGNATRIADVIEASNTEQYNNLVESYQIVSIMLAMEKMRYWQTRNDNWGFGAAMRYELAQKNIQINRAEWYAFYAQKGDWETNKSKNSLMSGNVMAVAFHCADLYSRLYSLTGKQAMNNHEDMPQDTRQLYDSIWENAKEGSPRAIIEGLVRAFVPACIGEDAMATHVEPMLNWMANGDFYNAPASTKYHLAYPGGLAIHTCNVIWYQVQIQKPRTAAELGKIILSAVCHDFCKVNFYKPTYRNVKVYADNGSKQEPDGRRFDWNSIMQYEVNDQLPLGHGFKSMHMALGFLREKMPRSVAAAICAHMNDPVDNPDVEKLLAEYPLALTLHMADMMASQIAEHEM